jgi:hypothetical protein
MTTLILKKQSQGYYTNQVGNILIAVSLFNNEWTGIITDEKQTEDDKYIIFKCFGKTKKSVVNQLILKLI